MNILLYIGNDIVDLPDNVFVAITVQKINIGDLKSRYISYTNSFKANWTENNERIFGYAKLPQSSSIIPYRLQSGKFVQNGIEVLKTSLFISAPTQQGFTINVYESDVDFYDLIKGKTLKDINPIAPSGWQAADIDAARLNTDGIFTAVLNWGHGGVGPLIYEFDYFLPCFFYHSLIKSIIEFGGLEPVGAILTDPRFTDLVIPFPGEFKYPENFINDDAALAENNGQVFGGVVSTSLHRASLDVVVYGTFDLINEQYEFLSPVPVVAVVTAYLDCSSINFLSGTELYGKLYKFSGGIETELDTGIISTGLADGDVTLEYTGGFLPGDLIYYGLKSDAGGSPGVAGDIDSGSFLKILVLQDVNRDEVSWNELWPEIKAEDLLKDFFVRFGIVPKIKDGEMILKTLDEIINDKASTVDWSAKVVNPELDSIDVKPPYARDNYFEYEDSEEVNEVALGRGSIQVDNTTLDLVKTIFKSPFANSNTNSQPVGFYIYNVATIPAYDAASTGIGDMANTPGLRLLTLKDRTIENQIDFGLGFRSDFKLAYFVDPTQAKDTGFEYFLAQFYPSLSEALQKYKMMSKNILLNDLDIADYDSHRIVWDGQSYAIMNKIPNFKPSKVSKVELFKVF